MVRFSMYSGECLDDDDGVDGYNNVGRVDNHNNVGPAGDGGVSNSQSNLSFNYNNYANKSKSYKNFLSLFYTFEK
jgi:hypothetical protein